MEAITNESLALEVRKEGQMMGSIVLQVCQLKLQGGVRDFTIPLFLKLVQQSCK